MKTVVFLFSLLVLAASCTNPAPQTSNNVMNAQTSAAATATTLPPNPERPLIEEVITRFMRGGDESDTTLLNRVLHDQFRVIVNQGVLGAETLRVLDKPAYLKMIADKKYGGVLRSVTIISVSVAGSVAAAEVHTSSVRSDIISFLHLVKGKDGQWLLVGDTPFPTPKKAN